MHSTHFIYGYMGIGNGPVRYRKMKHAAQAGTMGWSYNPSHHELTLLPQSYISLLDQKKTDHYTVV